jgi:hypothetical protein
MNTGRYFRCSRTLSEVFAVWKLKQVKLEIYTACLMLGGLKMAVG